MSHLEAAGGCLCGAVRFIAAGVPIKSGICHCRSCRKAASAPGLPFLGFPAAGFHFTQGAPTEYQSSPGVVRGFCGRCGSPLTYRQVNQPDFLDIMTCSLDDPDGVPPTFHVWAEENLAWNVIADELSTFARTADDGDGGNFCPLRPLRAAHP